MPKRRSYLKRRREIEQCTTKIKYYDEVEARTAANVLRRATGCRSRVYRCPGLKGEQRHFHVTGGQKW